MAWLSPCGEKSQSLQLGLTKGAPLRPQQEAPFIFTGDTSDGDHYLVCAEVADKETISSLLPCVKTDTQFQLQQLLGVPDVSSWAPYFCSDKKSQISI